MCNGFLELQQMRGMPLLQNDNRYTHLEVKEINDPLDAPEPVMSKNPPMPKVKCLRWEKRKLPREYTLATTPSDRSLAQPPNPTTDHQHAAHQSHQSPPRLQSPPFAVLVCLTIWNNPVKPMTTSRDFATATFCPSLWIDPHNPY
jgi:hypothetical protein